MSQISKKRFFKILLVAFFFGLSIGLYFFHKSPNYQLSGKLISHITTTDSVVALTFDDGPFPKHFEEVLDVLDTFGIKATFFLNGKPMAENPSLAKEILKRGHQLANHSYSHKMMLFKSQSWMEEEIGETDKLIRGAGFEGEIFFRPPFGKKLISLPLYLSKNDRTTITWDVDADGKGGDKEIIKDRILAQTKPGSIILMHVLVSSRKDSRAALPEIIDELQKEGYRFVTVSELVNR